jgi:6-phosphofructokinase 1
MERIAVLTSGGDAPGMNAAIRAVVKVAASRGIPCTGVERGFDGLIDGQFVDLTRVTPEGLVPVRGVQRAGNAGGTMLGSARSDRFRSPEGRAEAATRLAEAGVDGLVVIGGNGSLTGAHLLAVETGARVVGLPGSIDNDVGCTASAIGVDTALNTIVDACDRIADTAQAHQRAFIVEVMGRQSGYLAMTSAVASAADGVLLPEIDRSREEILANTSALTLRAFATDRLKSHVLIIKAEGVDYPCTDLAADLEDRLAGTQVDVRATILGHVQRGGRPSSFDRMIAGRMGLVAVESLVDEVTDRMVAWQATVRGGESTSDPQLRLFPLAEVLAETSAMAAGTSWVTRWRAERMEAIHGILAL